MINRVRFAHMGAMMRSGNYAAVFHERAEELRSIAAIVHSNRNREILLKCAADYDEMARQHEQASAQGGVFKYPPTHGNPDGGRPANSAGKGDASA